jgi:hypothetical protein
MTTTDAYTVIVQQLRTVPCGRWHEIAARNVALLVASGQLTQEQAGDVLSLLMQRLARLLERQAQAREGRNHRKAERQRAYRARLAAGIAVFRVCAQSDHLADVLMQIGTLQSGEHTHAEIEAALGHAIGEWLAAWRR